MVITFQGENYFKIQSGAFTLLVDPANARSFKGAQVVVNTAKPPAVGEDAAEGEKLVWIENQGEYGIGEDVSVRGWSAGYEKGVEHTAYAIRLEEITVVVLGRLPGGKVPEGLVSDTEEVHVLIVPAGGETIREADAAKIVRQIEPGIVIPSLFAKDPKKFFAELNQSPAPEEKLVVKRKDITPGAMKAVWLKP